MDIEMSLSTTKYNPTPPANPFNLDQPLVSVIIPAYNAEAYILHTLNSVLSQTYKNIEVIVVDDGSHDKTAQVVESMMRHDGRVTLLRQANSGVAAARNLAIQKSCGEYIAPIDADDIWYPQKIERQVHCMLHAGQSTGLVYAWSVGIDERGLLTGGYSASDIEADVFVALIMHNFIGNASAPLIRRVCIEKVGGYCTRLFEQHAQGCEDRDLYLRIAESYEFRVVKEFLVGYRRVNSNMSFHYRSMEKSHRIVTGDVRRQHPDIPAFVYRWSWSHYYLYLSHQSRSCAHYGASMLYHGKAVRMSPVFLLYIDFHRSLCSCVLLMLKQAVISTMQVLPFPSAGNRKKAYPDQRKLTISDIIRNSSQSRSGLCKLHHLRLQYIQHSFTERMLYMEKPPRKLSYINYRSYLKQVNR